MLYPFTWPALGGSLLAAVALGVHLGESAIGLINPIHFQGPAVHPRDRGAAIDESSLRARRPAYGELYGWEQGHAARAADCGDCEALRARDAYARVYSAEVPHFGEPEDVRADDVREAVADQLVLVEGEAADEVVAPKDSVLRYAYYPVVAEEPRAEPDKYYPD